MEGEKMNRSEKPLSRSEREEQDFEFYATDPKTGVLIGFKNRGDQQKWVEEHREG